MKLKSILGAAAALLLLPAAASAADAPIIKTSATNSVPECVTPGRLMAFIQARNQKLEPKFERIAVEYMRRGEELGLRWDYAFYQMVLETGYLTFRGDHGRRGDVSPKQNNFAGMGATGRGNPGESFPDVATGVLAHLQHVLLYAGETVENPVAERTRKVQEWGILSSLKKKARGPVTFAHLATKWAPGSNYVAGLKAIAERFDAGFCRSADPHPEWVAEARGTTARTKVAAAPKMMQDKVSGDELAKRAIEQGKAEGTERLVGLGAGGIANSVPPSYSILNSPAAPTAGNAAPAAAVETGNGLSAAPATRETPPKIVTASAAGGLAKAAAVAKMPKPSTCRVWTASYGGLKALIIRVKTEKSVDYTVLDVNEGAEKREAEAYIAAYAKGGEIAGDFPTQTQALAKAFELCPEN